MISVRKTLFVIFLLCCVFRPFGAEAAERNPVTIGVGGVVATSEYKKTDAYVWPLPIINYEGERFYIRSLTAGMHLYKDSMHEFSVNVGYLPQYYKASRSDSWAMRQLDDRHSSMLAGASYRLTTDWGVANVSFSADITDHSNGFLADASYAYPFMLGKVKLSPSVGVLWTSSQYNDYYYGVSRKESRKSGLKRYKADDGYSPYIGLEASMNVTDNWKVYSHVRAMLLSDEITDSPMVNEEGKISFGAGISYSF